jgi:uncharacterized protein YndB with AHSA1/START domain
MTLQSHHHATLVFERTCGAPVERVFAAFADPAARARWGVPSETAALIYDEADFRVGGRDIFRCGAKENPHFLGETHYHDIVTDRRIVSSETIDSHGKRLSVGLTTTTFAPEGPGTKVNVTVQLVSLNGNDMVEGTKMGTNAALDNLVRVME